MCLPHSWDRRVWKKYYPSSASGTPLHICLMAKWLIILGIPIQDTPRRQRTNKGLCLLQVSPPAALPALVFHSLSYREWGPLLNLTGHLENDHLRDFSHKRLNNTVYRLSFGGWVRVHAQGARCTTWLGFHGVTLDDSSWLRHAILLTATKMFCLFWLGLLWSAQVALWGEGVGSRFRRKAPIRTPSSLIKFVATQKEQQSHPQGCLEEEKRSYRRTFSVRVSPLQQLRHPSLHSSLHSVPSLTVAPR